MNPDVIRLLLVDDDEDSYFLTKDLLSDAVHSRFEFSWVSKYEEVGERLAKSDTDVCLIDHYLGARTGLDLIQELKAGGVRIPLILITGRDDRDIDIAAMKAGAVDYLSKGELTGALLDRSIRYSLQRRRDEDARRELEHRLILSQKLEAIGQLAAGLAHEINTPVQYIGSNVAILAKRLPKVFKLLGALMDGRADETPADERAVIAGYGESTLRALDDCQEGVRRITEIVSSVQDFAHPSVTDEKTRCNLGEIIETTIKLARNEWKYIGAVRAELSPEITEVSLIRGRFSQALLNLLINACHAIADRRAKGDKRPGEIVISTQPYGAAEFQLRIRDNGSGIREDIRHRIFDPFFTTKEVGKGTGQGLALVHSVIWKDHGGRIDVESEVGAGTTFTLTLPR